jgi:predicted membrane protein
MQTVLMPLIQAVVALIIVVILAWLIDHYVPEGGKTRRLLSVVFALIVVGIGLWLINTYVPMAESIKAILNIVVVVAMCVYALKATGVWVFIEETWNRRMERRADLRSSGPFPRPISPQSESAPPPHPVR